MSLINRNSHAPSFYNSLNPEEVDMLRDAFIYMDRDNDGHLSRDELLSMVLCCVGDDRFKPLKEYLIPLFDVADKDKDNKLSLAEFLMSFADGPGVVPAEVINSCVSSIRIRLTDEEIEALQETFRRIDTKSDGYIDKEELIDALKENLNHRFPDLQENNFNDIAVVIMASADTDCDGRLCLSEFIRSFQEDQGVLPAAFVDVRAHRLVQQLTAAEIDVLKDAFNVLDKNRDGYIEAADLYNVLGETLYNGVEDKTQIQELCDVIMVTADKREGFLSLSDFVRSFIRNINLMQLPVAAAQEKMRSSERLLEMLESGELEQLTVAPENSEDESSCVDPDQLVKILVDVFRDVFPSLDENILFSVVSAIVVASGNESDQRISLDDFIQCFAEGPRIISESASMAQDSGDVTEEDLQLVSQVLKEMGSSVDGTGCVQEPDVLRAIRSACGNNLQQADRVLGYVRTKMTRRSSSSSMVVEASVQEYPDHLRRISSPNAVQKVPNFSDMQEVLGSSPLRKQQQQRQLQVLKKEAEAPCGIHATMASPVVCATRRSANSRKGRSFGSCATVSDVLVKQHARRYLESVYDTADGAVFDDELRMEFAKYAKENQDYIDRDRFIEAYLAMEHYGLQPSEKQVEKLISRHCKGDKIMYNEFCIIMLQRARM